MQVVATILGNIDREIFHYHRNFYCSALFQQFTFSASLCYKGLFHKPYFSHPITCVCSPLALQFLILTQQGELLPKWAPSLWLVQEGTALHPGKECGSNSHKAINNPEPGSHSNILTIGIWSHSCFWTFYFFCPQIHSCSFPKCPSSCQVWPWITFSCNCLRIPPSFRRILGVFSLWLAGHGLSVTYESLENMDPG